VNDNDDWIYFDGPEPEHIRPLLDALRDLLPSTPDDKQRMVRRLFERLDAELAQKGEPPVATAAPAAASARAPGERRVGEDGATARSPSFDERPAAPPPAEPPPAEPPPLPVDAREPRPPDGRPAEDLTTTSLMVEIPAEFRAQMGRLPFKPRAPGTELARTMQTPVLNPRRGETAPLGDDSIAKAVAALPFAGDTVGAALVPYPRLSLEAYASLRAELSLWPEQSAEILPRYHVMNEAACRALDEHWQSELAASPEARATFDKLLADYMAWLRTRRG
jgi:hypothetical protein